MTNNECIAGKKIVIERSSPKKYGAGSSSIIGREEERANIDELFNTSAKVVFLTGIGGIGKTELALKYAYENFNGNVLPMVYLSDSDLKEGITYNLIQSKVGEKYRENDIRLNAAYKTLLIIDNYNLVADESLLEELVKCPYEVLITTRKEQSISSYNDIQQIDIQSLPIEIAFKVFQKYFGEKIPEDDKYIFQGIYCDFYGNTQAIILIAKMLNTQGMTLMDYEQSDKKFIIEENVYDVNKEETVVQKLYRFLQITDFFESKEEGERESYSSILSVLIIIQQFGIDEKYLKDTFGLKNKNAFITLSKNGLITRKKIDADWFLEMHPLIAKVLELYGIESTEQSIKIVKEYINNHYKKGVKKTLDRKALDEMRGLVYRVTTVATDERLEREIDRVIKRTEKQKKDVDVDKEIHDPQRIVKVDLLDVLFDEDNKAPIFMNDDRGNLLEFEQVAVIPYDEDDLYVILKPNTPILGVNDDEAIVFVVDETDDGESVLRVESDEAKAIEIFNEYYKLFMTES